MEAVNNQGDVTGSKPELRARVDEEGRLVLPPYLSLHYGLRPGTQVRIDEVVNGLRLRPPVTHLAKVYIEPTNYCNLECRTCIRRSWDEPLGQMSDTTFAHIIDGLRVFCPAPTVFLGGFGEPTAHPHIVEMVARARALGAPVELITNGTILTRELSGQLIEAGLNMLWVSLDGATPESYADVRLGAALPEVLNNITNFREIRRAAHLSAPQLGISFVAMRRNIADLPAVLRLGSHLGAKRFLVTNVLPYTAEMCKEVLYSRALNDIVFQPSVSQLELPKIDVDEITREALYKIMRGCKSITFAGVYFGQAANDRCPFVESGATAVGWDGNLSPCLPLMHNHVSFLDEQRRFSRRYVVGSLVERNLKDLWNAPEYQAFRERVQEFVFSFCTHCGGCDLAQGNEEDCFGNTFPTCGGCLWAQGVIRCP